jgi:hypothetical protein
VPGFGLNGEIGSYKIGEDVARAALLITLLLGASQRLLYIPGRRSAFYRCCSLSI